MWKKGLSSLCKNLDLYIKVGDKGSFLKSDSLNNSTTLQLSLRIIKSLGQMCTWDSSAVKVNIRQQVRKVLTQIRHSSAWWFFRGKMRKKSFHHQEDRHLIKKGTEQDAAGTPAENSTELYRNAREHKEHASFRSPRRWGVAGGVGGKMWAGSALSNANAAAACTSLTDFWGSAFYHQTLTKAKSVVFL